MPHPLLELLLGQLVSPFTGEALFDALADLAFFMKNERGEYVLVNQTLVQRCGVSDKEELIGRTAAEVFPEPLGRNYLAQDIALLETGEPLLNELELHTYPSREAGWCLTTKLPLKGQN